ncbi:MAG TPA: S1/P1 Nuclease, partial [Vicingus sp.]|nr:S1/P1 Nuclease [Vicingus sp.]
DKRRYAVEGEAPRHYIDLDHYVKDGEDPFDVVPKPWTKAVEKFTEDTLQAYGIVPWHVNLMVMRLTKAFEEKDVDKILRVSADLGHYIGDS